MIDVKLIEADTAFIWLHSVRGMPPDKIASLIDYWLDVHKHRNGPAARFEIASAKLTKRQMAVVTDHASKIGVQFDGFNDLLTAQLRRAMFPPAQYGAKQRDQSK